MNVPLLDLQAQYASLREELEEAVLRVSRSQRFILGPEVEHMERSMESYLEVKHALGVSSGTDALLLALMALDIKPGDEVIVPTFTFFATAGTVSRLGATPRFVDVDPDTYNIDPDGIAAAITERTRAIIPVHLFGQSAEMDRIMEIADRHGIPVVEDAAQAIGTRYRDGRRAGSIGRVGCFSFFPSKNLGCFGDGGLITTNDSALYERMRIMRVHGGEPKYHYQTIGGNFRLDELQAAVLSVKLPHLDGWSAARARNAAIYDELLGEEGNENGADRTVHAVGSRIGLPKRAFADAGVEHDHIYNQYVIRSDRRDELRAHLSANSIGCEIYYPIPLHMQECFADLGYKEGELPISERAAREVLALPIYPELTHEQIEHVARTVRSFA